MNIVSAALVLFFVMDPFGNIPVFLSVLERVEPRRRKIVLARELVIALVFLVAFLFLGRFLLDVLNLEDEAIRVGGGIVLFLIALRLVFPPEKALFGGGLDGEPLVFPLAVPMIAGPSSFATVLLLAESIRGHHADKLLAIGSAWLAAALILFAAPALLRVFGRRGLMALERLMGMLLVMLSVQMVLEGIRAFLARP